MNLPSDIFGLIFVLLFFGLIVTFSTTRRKQQGRTIREIPAFARLVRAVGLAVEAGQRLHLSIGRGNLAGPQSAVGFVGLSVLDRITRVTAIADRPPIATTGESALVILARDSLRGASRATGAELDPSAGQLTGLTPFSYAAGAMSVVHDEEIGANVLVGNFGSEVALISEASESTGSLTLAGTDNVPAQAILYATSQEPLIGEEVFAMGAYVGVGPLHIASLRAQDVLRWVLIAILLIGALVKLAGVL